MCFRDYPFVNASRRYPIHVEVLNYLEEFAKHFQLNELIRFGTEVVDVRFIDDYDEEKGADTRKWALKWKNKSDLFEEVFDAVVVCSGHNTQPRIADFPGFKTWPGKQIHSHSYRVPEPFRNQVVVVIGNAPSAKDISRELVRVAKEVHVAIRSLTKNETPTKHLVYDNMWLHPMIESAHKDGSVVFEDGSSILVDVIIHCTGYKYHFPFLEANNLVTVDENRVGPLYKQVFQPFLSPGLSFIGMHLRVAHFPLFELTAKWVAGVLSGQISLPSKEEMVMDVEAFYLKLEAESVPKHHSHKMMNIKLFQAESIDWLSKECKCLPWEEWRKQMEVEAFTRPFTNPETYRDEWEDDHLILQAQQDFLKYLSPKRSH